MCWPDRGRATACYTTSSATILRCDALTHPKPLERNVVMTDDGIGLNVDCVGLYATALKLSWFLRLPRYRNFSFRKLKSLKEPVFHIWCSD